MEQFNEMNWMKNEMNKVNSSGQQEQYKNETKQDYHHPSPLNYNDNEDDVTSEGTADGDSNQNRIITNISKWSAGGTSNLTQLYPISTTTTFNSIILSLVNFTQAKTPTPTVTTTLLDTITDFSSSSLFENSSIPSSISFITPNTTPTTTTTIINDTIMNAAATSYSATTITAAIDDGGGEDKIMENIFIQTPFYIVYTTIFIIGIIGNVLVCYVVCRNKAMHTVTNFFITNLALSDILLCILAVPFTPLYTFIGKWIFGNVLCHLVPYAQGVSVYISTLTLTSIALDRFIVIIYPFRHRMKISTCILLITCIWICSLLLTLPFGMYMRLTYDVNDNVNYCEEDWPSESFRKIYGTLTVVLQFILPLLIISVCYILVSYKLNDRAKSKPGSKTAKKEEADRDRKRRTNRMLISMVAVFAISWMPLNAVNIINDYYETNRDIYTLLFFLAHCTATSSTCYNPFLYAWLNENFRKEFKQVIPCFQRTGGYNGVGGRGGGGSGIGGGVSRAFLRSTTDGKFSQNDGLTEVTTRTSEIVPRGPTTCNFSIKKSTTTTTPRPIMGISAEEKDNAKMPLKMEHNNQDNTLTSSDFVKKVVNNKSNSDDSPDIVTNTTVILPTGLLETQFDIVTDGELIMENCK